MFEGWVWWSGEMYTATLETTLAQLREDRKFVVQRIGDYTPDLVVNPEDWTEFWACVERVKKNQETDLDLLTIAYQIDILYWTEWHDEPEDEWDEPPYRIEKKI